jgi:hypothetical protein
MINPLKKVFKSKKVIFKVSYETNRSLSWSRNSDFWLRGAWVERCMVCMAPQHWHLIVNDEFFVPLQDSLKHLSFTTVPLQSFPRIWRDFDRDRNIFLYLETKWIIQNLIPSQVSSTITCKRLLCPSCSLCSGSGAVSFWSSRIHPDPSINKQKNCGSGSGFLLFIKDSKKFWKKVYYFILFIDLPF